MRLRRRVSAPFALLVAAGLLTAPLVGASEPATLRFALHGETLATRSIDWMRRTAAARSVKVLEPYEEREAVFAALPLASILDAVYTTSWRQQKDLLFVFTCSDGYQPTLPVDRLLKHRAWLAFDRQRADSTATHATGFTIEKLESGEHKIIALAPFYLIWENLEDEIVRGEGDYGWPYQLVGIDLVRAEDRFPNMAPPEGASADALAGFAAFRIHCSRCHAIDGQGGRIGPDLQTPINATRARSAEWLRSWIDDPSRILPTSRMPRFQVNLEDRAQAIDQIIAYLASLAVAGDTTISRADAGHD